MLAQDVKQDANGQVFVKQTAHDDLNANANLQVGNADVANGNPVPVSDAGGSLTVDANNLDIRDIDHATDDILVYGWDGSANQKIKTDNTGELQIDVVSSALPSGAATEATLAAISGKMSPANAALTQIPQSDTTGVILASAASRKGFIIVNESTDYLYLAFAATASAAAYTVKLQPNSVYEKESAIYTGVISGIWSAAGAGQALVTELT